MHACTIICPRHKNICHRWIKYSPVPLKPSSNPRKRYASIKFKSNQVSASEGVLTKQPADMASGALNS